MSHGAHSVILCAVVTFGLFVAIGRPLLKLRNEAFTLRTHAPVFDLRLLKSGTQTVLPVVVVP